MSEEVLSLPKGSVLFLVSFSPARAPVATTATAAVPGSAERRSADAAGAESVSSTRRRALTFVAL